MALAGTRAASSFAFSKMVVPFDGFDRSQYTKLLHGVGP